MKAEAELSDKEWRQMRRQMSKLDFEPVPETPALLPRSLYGESDQELASIYEEKPEESVGVGAVPTCHCHYSPKNAAEQKRPPESTFELNDAELAALDAQMAAAQDATRRLVMGAFLNLKTKKAKTEALERMKLSATHASDIKILQVVSSACCVDWRKVGLLCVLCQERNGERSVVACFRAWNEMTRQRAARYAALHRVLAQACKRQQFAGFRYWKESAQMFLLQKKLQDQRDVYEHRIVEMAKEYQLKIQQLQQDIDDAKCQVAESQKCRRKLEEDLRLVFLRGVSAMNIEALSVFGSSHKQLRKLGEQERSVLPSRQKESNSNQIAESVKTNAVSFSELAVSEIMTSPKEPTSPELLPQQQERLGQFRPLVRQIRLPGPEGRKRQIGNSTLQCPRCTAIDNRIPQFFMTNADNPVPTRPARPLSARPRMRSTPKSSLDDGTLNGSYSRPNGMRRKRQGGKLVHARIRAVYNDVGRSSFPMKQMAAPYSTTSALSSKSRGLQEADMHDEYYRLLDSESELKAALLQEQQKRVKAVAHVRRLEEVIAMKDKKIESLLHAKSVGADRSMGTTRSVGQREMAGRDRQLHAITQKLKQKLAQQSQLLGSYEEAMQSLRSGVKSTNLMELEEERSQLYQELRHQQILLDQQRFEWETHQQKLVAFAEAEGNNKLQVAKLQQETKTIAYEKRKLEQEVGYLKSRVEQLQSNLTLEQRKRTYDREFSDSVGKHAFSPPTQKVMLAQALEEMKKFMRREKMASIKQEKLKSPKTGVHTSRLNTLSPQDASKASTLSPGCCYYYLPVAIARLTYQDQEDKLASKQQTDRNGFIIEEPKAALVVLPGGRNLEDQPIDISQSDKDVDFAHTDLIQESHHAENHKPSSVDADPGRYQQSGGVPCTTAGGVHNADQTTDEEMDAIQQQKLASIASVLGLDIADDPDSELSSIDMLDDAQHLRSDPEMNSIDDAADAALINFEVSKEETGDVEVKALPVAVEVVAQEEAQGEEGQSSQSLDDLYAEDFLDTSM
ncbi:hypothetical protein GQ600_8932 [Phytophthora cactorum]|nr:hypothetical protein GQ600_8932 [Phytophthora cactorum]